MNGTRGGLIHVSRMNQTVRLRKSAGGWKVMSFENVFDKMDSLTGR